MVRPFGAVILAALAMSLSVSSSAVPSLLTQQGRLFDKESSEPLSGAVALAFTIYDDPSASDASNVLWTESQTVTLDEGYFSAMLGEETALDPAIFDGSVRYLGVKVGADDEMTPRQPITSVPYALAVSWAGIQARPTPCTAPQFLRGFNASGAPVCAAASLSCTRRTSPIAMAVTVSTASCHADELMTGGGCATTGTLKASSGALDDPNEWRCETAGAADIFASAHCCKVQ